MSWGERLRTASVGGIRKTANFSARDPETQLWLTVAVDGDSKVLGFYRQERLQKSIKITELESVVCVSDAAVELRRSSSTDDEPAT
jgi:hypothetical protein